MYGLVVTAVEVCRDRGVCVCVSCREGAGGGALAADVAQDSRAPAAVLAAGRRQEGEWSSSGALCPMHHRESSGNVVPTQEEEKQKQGKS